MARVECSNGARSPLEIDDDLRAMVLYERQRSAASIAIHLDLRVRSDYQFRTPLGEATLDNVVGRIVAAIWSIPDSKPVPRDRIQAGSQAGHVN
jgi:hypothetical protein